MKRKAKPESPRFTVMQVMVKFCGEHDVFDLEMIAQAIRKFDKKGRPFHRFLCQEPCDVDQDEARDLRLTQPAIKLQLVRGNVWYYACLEPIRVKAGASRVLRIVNGNERRQEASGVWWNGHWRGTDPRRFLREKDLQVVAELA